jgi:hypothetical protein
MRSFRDSNTRLCLFKKGLWKSCFNNLSLCAVIGAKVRARRCSIRWQSEREARNSAIFCHPAAERYSPAPNPPGILPLLLCATRKHALCRNTILSFCRSGSSRRQCQSRLYAAQSVGSACARNPSLLQPEAVGSGRSLHSVATTQASSSSSALASFRSGASKPSVNQP